MIVRLFLWVFFCIVWLIGGTMAIRAVIDYETRRQLEEIKKECIHWEEVER